MNLYQSIEAIAHSIKARGSQQGEKVFDLALKQLPELESDSERADFLKRLNKALTGMEAQIIGVRVHFLANLDE